MQKLIRGPNRYFPKGISLPLKIIKSGGLGGRSACPRQRFATVLQCSLKIIKSGGLGGRSGVFLQKSP
jgi:hypothetical protein